MAVDRHIKAVATRIDVLATITHIIGDNGLWKIK